MPGSPYSTVLVGTDGSSSLRAVDRAAVISRNAGARLLIASASNKSAARGASGPDSASAAVQDACAAPPAARDVGADSIDTPSLYGDPVDELTGAAKKRNVDLVAVGNRGMNRLSGRLLGSVPANLSHRVSCDVHIVHTTGQSQ